MTDEEVKEIEQLFEYDYPSIEILERHGLDGYPTYKVKGPHALVVAKLMTAGKELCTLIRDGLKWRDIEARIGKEINKVVMLDVTPVTKEDT